MNFKMVTLFAILVVTSACSKDNNKSAAAAPTPDAQTAPKCTGLECMESVNWKLLLQGQMFPVKTRVEINGATVLDECLGKQQFEIDRDAAPQSLTLEKYLVPKIGQVKIHMFDMGHDCSTETSFYSNENAKFDIVKTATVAEVVFNL